MVLKVKDADAASQNIKTTTDGGGTHTPHHNAQLQVGGADVGPGNPVPVTAASLPLPTGAAVETGGNLAALATGTGAPADAAYAGSGSSSVVAALKGLYALLTQTLSVNQAGVSTTGAISALNESQAMALNGATGFAVALSGTFTATLRFEGTIDGSTWFTLADLVPVGGAPSASAVSTATGAGQWKGNGSGLQGVRVFSTSYTSGTVNVTLRAMQAAGHVSAMVTGASSMPISGSLTTVSTVTSVTNAGTPTVPATPYFLNSAASTNGALIITGTSGLQAFFASNSGASDAWVRLFNKATAPVVGTDIPEMLIRVAAGGQFELSPGFNGYRFPLGLGIAITGGSADTDTTAVAAGQVKVKLSRTV